MKKFILAILLMFFAFNISYSQINQIDTNVWKFIYNKPVSMGGTVIAVTNKGVYLGLPANSFYIPLQFKFGYPDTSLTITIAADSSTAQTLRITTQQKRITDSLTAYSNRWLLKWSAILDTATAIGLRETTLLSDTKDSLRLQNKRWLDTMTVLSNRWLLDINSVKDSMTAIELRNTNLLQEQIDSLTKFRNFNLIKTIYTDPDTSGIFRCTLDSVPITSTYWFDINAYTSDSTIFLCFIRTFTLHTTIPIPAGSHSVKQYDMSLAPYGYIYKKTQTRQHTIEINSH